MTHYQISRNGQMYGPYTLEDLQRYVTSGNVLPTDLAKSEEMTEWVPVSQVLGSQPTGFSDSGFTAPAAAATGFSSSGYTDPAYPTAAQPTFNASAFPDAPNLNWGLALLFNILSCGWFLGVWNLVVALWLKKVQPNASSYIAYIAVLALLVAEVLFTYPIAYRQIHAAMANPNMVPRESHPAFALLWVLIRIVKLVARFMQRASLEQHFNTVENVGLKLNPVMTFFFGGLYFQYHLNKINAYKQATRMSQPAGY